MKNVPTGTAPSVWKCKIRSICIAKKKKKKKIRRGFFLFNDLKYNKLSGDNSIQVHGRDVYTKAHIGF